MYGPLVYIHKQKLSVKKSEYTTLIFCAELVAGLCADEATAFTCQFWHLYFLSRKDYVFFF